MKELTARLRTLRSGTKLAGVFDKQLKQAEFKKSSGPVELGFQKV